MNANDALVPAIAFAILIVAIAIIFTMKGTPARFCFGGKCFSGEIADNPFKKAIGMMFRGSVPQDYGMVFPMKGMNTSFWMKNVKFPLEMICMKDGKVTEIIVMETCDRTNECTYYRPKTEIDYAVETNIGFCARNGVKEGAAFSLQ